MNPMVKQTVEPEHRSAETLPNLCFPTSSTAGNIFSPLTAQGLTKTLEINYFTDATATITFTFAARLSREDARREGRRSMRSSLLPVSHITSGTFTPQKNQDFRQ